MRANESDSLRKVCYHQVLPFDYNCSGRSVDALPGMYSSIFFPRIINGNVLILFDVDLRCWSNCCHLRWNKEWWTVNIQLNCGVSCVHFAIDEPFARCFKYSAETINEESQGNDYSKLGKLFTNAYIHSSGLLFWSRSFRI